MSTNLSAMRVTIGGCFVWLFVMMFWYLSTVKIFSCARTSFSTWAKSLSLSKKEWPGFGNLWSMDSTFFAPTRYCQKHKTKQKICFARRNCQTTELGCVHQSLLTPQWRSSGYCKPQHSLGAPGLLSICWNRVVPLFCHLSYMSQSELQDCIAILGANKKLYL